MQKYLFKDFEFVIVRPRPKDVIKGGSVYIEGNTIKAVGKTTDVLEQIEEINEVTVVDGKGKLLMPGLVDAHTHIGEWGSMVCYNYADYTVIPSVEQTLDTYFWPAVAWYSEEAAYDLTLFGLAHMFKNGTTTCSNNFLWADPTTRAILDSGARAINHVNILTTFQRKDAKDGAAQLANIEKTAAKYHDPDGRVQVGIGPDAAWNIETDILVKGIELAEQLDLPFGIHIGEGVPEMEQCDKLWASDGGYMKHLHKLGVLTPRTIFWHGIAFNDEQIDMLADLDVSVAFSPLRCPDYRENTRVAYMLHKGMRVGVGTDHASHNIFRAVQAAWQLQDTTDREHHLEYPWTPLELATTRAASALHLEDKVGTLDVGKRADMITYDISRDSNLFPHMESSIIAGLVMQGPGGETHDVMVDGKLLRQNGKFTELDEDDLWERVTRWLNEFKDFYETGLREGKRMIVRNHADYADV